MLNARLVLLSALMIGAAASGAAESERSLQVEIQSPSAGFTVEDGATSIEVEGIASAIGGVRYLDIMFVMDTSGSLRSSDPQDYRSLGAIGLVENLSRKSDIKIGVVSFDKKSDLAQPMTSSREHVINTLKLLPRSGSTNLAAGIETAVAELERNGRPGSSRVIMLFTDGMSNKNKAYDTAVEATKKGITIQALMLGSSNQGAKILDTIDRRQLPSCIRSGNAAGGVPQSSYHGRRQRDAECKRWGTCTGSARRRNFCGELATRNRRESYRCVRHEPRWRNQRNLAHGKRARHELRSAGGDGTS